MKKQIILHIILLVLCCTQGACALYSWSDPIEKNTFPSAKIAKFGEIGVFTFSKTIYQRPTGLINTFPDGGGARYIEVIHGIATYNFDTQEVKVLRLFDNINNKDSKWLSNGNGGQYWAGEALGKLVFVRQTGTNKEYRRETDEYFLNLETGGLTPRPFREELERLGRDEGQTYLLDEDGLIVFVNPPFGSEPNWNRDKNIKKELWLRFPSGKYERIAEIVHYYGYKDDSLHFWATDGGSTIYELNSKSYRKATRDEYRSVLTKRLKEQKPSLVMKADIHKENLLVGKHIDGKYVYEKLDINVEDLFDH